MQPFATQGEVRTEKIFEAKKAIVKKGCRRGPAVLTMNPIEGKKGLGNLEARGRKERDHLEDG